MFSCFAAESHSPVNKLTQDVLGEILSMVVRCDPHSQISDYHPITTPHTHRLGGAFLLSLSHVCQSWRFTLLRLPTLWTSLPLHSPTSGMVWLVKLWLERGRSCPIQFYLDGGGDPDVLAVTLEILLEHANRWKAIQMTLPAAYQRPLRNLQSLNLRFMSLETIEVYFFSGWDVQLIHQFASLLYSSPVLHTVACNRNFILFDNIRTIFPPYSQIRDLNVHAIGITPELVLALGKCEKLERLTFQLPDLSNNRLPATTLPHLRFLKLDFPQWTSQLFDALTLPALGFADMNDAFFDEPEQTDWRSFESMIERSNCSLTAFRLAHDVKHEGIIISRLSSPIFRNLTRLELGFVEVKDEVISYLNPQKTPGVLRHLEILILSGCSSCDGNLSSMAFHRFKVMSGTRFKRLDVKMWNHAVCYPVDTQMFQELSEEGFDISIIFRWKPS